MELLERVRAGLPPAEEKRMFGGVAFMVDGALACSLSPRGLLVRTGPEAFDAAAGRPGVQPMVMGGRASRSWVEVDLAVLEDADVLREWLDVGVAAARAAGGS
ncbi:TfoX/Sxy family protein [Phycicoccus sonneratiae]|uniref:TfoX/Sxy family protein n=1 Tax=Phycicoccus sonneratiae TaxID=2807628 RepID=A0ABS2CGA9_9MICO|nr:TfoX/Sxy family protein [Phycicoccus sonneraticus]MBM6398912.1 TfoX/Sxy family protein [Phycicoccus sonneraticus]